MQIGRLQNGLAQIGPCEIGPCEIGPCEIGPCETCENGPSEIGPYGRGEGTRGAFVAGPRYVLGADAALSGVPYCYHAVAATPVVAIGVQASALTDLIEDHFELGRRSLEHFAREEIRLQAPASETEPAGAVEAAPRRAAR